VEKAPQLDGAPGQNVPAEPTPPPANASAALPEQGASAPRKAKKHHRRGIRLSARDADPSLALAGLAAGSGADASPEAVQLASLPPAEAADGDWDDTRDEPLLAVWPDAAEGAGLEDSGGPLATAMRARVGSGSADPADAQGRAQDSASAAGRDEQPAAAPVDRLETAVQARSRPGGRDALTSLFAALALMASGAAAWLALQEQAELERIDARLTIQPAAAPVPWARTEPRAATGQLGALSARLDQLHQQIAALEARPSGLP